MTQLLCRLAAFFAILTCAPATAQVALPYSSLSPRGAIQDSDYLGDQPLNYLGTKYIRATALKDYVATSLQSFGAVGNGVADDTAAIQAAFDSGQALTCNGVYKISATINVTHLANSGQRLVGSGPTGPEIVTTNHCTIRPTSAVTTAFLIDGVSIPCPGTPFCYVTSVLFSDLTLDMTNMPAGSKGFKQGQSFDIRYERVRVAGDTGKYSWFFGPGAFVTELDTVQGNSVSCIGNGTQNPTTITLTNPDILQISQEQCANFTLLGGAVQASYNPGGTTVSYIAPGNTNLLGFYPTTAALWAVTGGTPAGIYVALSNYTLNAQNLTSSGTDFEVLNQPPATCSIAGSSWAFGTYNDGTHGCLPIVWAFSIGANTHDCSFDNPVFAGEYLWTPVNPTCSVRGYFASTANEQHNVYPNYNDFTGGINVLNSQAIAGYTDLGASNISFLLDASDGSFLIQTEGVTPPSDNLNFVNWYNHAGQQIGGVTSQTTIADSEIFATNGASFAVFDSMFAQRAFMQGSTGLIQGNSIKARPATNSPNNALVVVDPTNLIQTLNCGTGSAAPLGDVCYLAEGANLNFYSDAVTTMVASINGTSGVGTFKGVVTAPVAIASLPGSPVAGERAAVNNADACTFGSTPVHTSGALFCPVVYNGSAWVAG